MLLLNYSNWNYSVPPTKVILFLVFQEIKDINYFTYVKSYLFNFIYIMNNIYIYIIRITNKIIWKINF